MVRSSSLRSIRHSPGSDWHSAFLSPSTSACATRRVGQRGYDLHRRDEGRRGASNRAWPQESHGGNFWRTFELVSGTDQSKRAIARSGAGSARVSPLCIRQNLAPNDRFGSWLRENVLAGADTSEHQLTNSGTGKLAMFLQLRAGIDCIACPAAVSGLVVVSRVWARADAQPSRPDRRLSVGRDPSDDYIDFETCAVFKSRIAAGAPSRKRTTAALIVGPRSSGVFIPYTQRRIAR
jgi:hypothetical protein